MGVAAFLFANNFTSKTKSLACIIKLLEVYKKQLELLRKKEQLSKNDHYRQDTHHAVCKSNTVVTRQPPGLIRKMNCLSESKNIPG